MALLLWATTGAAAGLSAPTFGPLRVLNANAASDTGDDLGLRAATDGAGTWIAVWESRGAFGEDADVLVSRSTDGGIRWSAPAPLDPAAASDADDDTQPAVATDGAGTWIAVWRARAAAGSGSDPHVRYARSVDDGATWSPGAALDPVAAADGLLDDLPWVAAGANGTWLVGWQRQDPSQTLLTDFDVVVARSTDAGGSWGAPAPITADAAYDERPDRFLRLAGGGPGHWLAVWQMDDRTSDVKSDTDVVVARSTDDALSWSAPLLLNPNDEDGPRDDMNPHLAGDGQGGWVAVWQSNDALATLGEDYDVLASRSTDDGVTWTPPAPVNRNAAIDRAADLDPQVASDGVGRFVAVWQSSESIGLADNAFHVRLARSRDGGATWTPSRPLAPKPVAGPTGQFDPQIAADAGGGWLVASYHFGGFGSDTDLVLSRGAAPFGPAAALDDAAATDTRSDGEPSVASHAAGSWIAAWSSSGPGSPLGSDADLLFARSSDGGRSWSAATPQGAAASDTAEDTAVQVASDGAACVAVWRVSDPGGPWGGDGDVLVARSLDAGATWSPPAALAADAGADARQEQAPHLASDGAGGFVAVWEAVDAAGPLAGESHVRTSRSTDGGATWTAPAPLDPDAGGDGIEDFAPRVAADGAGTWLAVWRASDPSGGPGRFDVRAARSDDGGASWSPPVVLDGSGPVATSAGDPRVASDGAGGWLVVWSATDPAGAMGSDGDLLAVRSSDGGQSFSAPASLEADAASDAAVDEAPQVASDGAGTWLVVWQTSDPAGATGSDLDLVVARSADGGASWSAPEPFDEAAHDTGDDHSPQLASDGAGGWLAAWTSTEPLADLGGDPDVLFATAAGPDTDGDGLDDAAEARIHGTDPALADGDGDGLLDGEEIVVHGSDPFDGDSDGDLLGDFEEVFVHGADPNDVDGDGDGVGDWDEVEIHGSDPLDTDSDGDGLDDYEEIVVYGTKPTDRDTDNDRWDDDEEVLLGSDPNDPTSVPATIPGLGVPGALGLALALLLASRRRMRRAAGLAALGALVLGPFAPHAAHAIDPSLCADDGVTEVPPFALGRDADQCLLLDPGNGGPPVPIQYEVFHRHGISETATRNPDDPSIDVIDLRADAYGRCRTRDEGEYCTHLIWDVVLDNYLDPAVKNDDIWYSSKGDAFEYLLVKDSRFYNGWKCQGGAGWSGPNGLHCPTGEDSGSHSDGAQWRGEPVAGGWIVMQDSELVNAHNALLRVQATPSFPPHGSLAFQGFRIGQSNEPTGAAKSWIDDCLARGASTGICYENAAVVDYHAQELWLVDVSGSARFGGFEQIGKLVVVNTGCGVSGCNGHVGYDNGWPHPLTTNTTEGPSACPDGPLAATPPWTGVAAVYCYTSLEKAALDHILPPFLQLSPSGWESPPGG